MEYQIIGYISFFTIRNECQDLGIVYKQPKLELEKGDDYEEKKGKIDRYKKISSVLFKKDSTRI